MDIIITMRDGAAVHFTPEGRASARVEFVPGVVMVIDEFDRQTAFPLDTVSVIEVKPSGE